MARTFNCPTCNAPLDYSGAGETVHCPYCANLVIVPPEMRPNIRPDLPSQADPARVFITPEQLVQVKALIRDGQKIEAIKIYREATTLGLKEAKDAVEAIEAGDPELKKLPGDAKKNGFNAFTIVSGLVLLAIASIFPVAFIPMGIQSLQAHQYASGFFSILGAVIWAVIWGGLGVVFLFWKS